MTCILGFSELTLPHGRALSYQDTRLAQAFKDFMLALPTSQVVLVFDYTVGKISSYINYYCIILNNILTEIWINLELLIGTLTNI